MGAEPIRRAGTAHIVAVLLSAIASLGASCPQKQGDCRYDSTERCLWEAGVAPPTPTENDPDPDGQDSLGDGGVASECTQLDETLGEMVSIIGAGLEWTLIDEYARALCSEPPNTPVLQPDLPPPARDAWTCAIRELDLDQQALELEASNGVLSLTAADIGDAESAALFESAQRRFDGWCAGSSFEEFEGEGLAEFYRCSLAEGPYLVIARFPRDLKAGRWQVSIAIVDAG